MKARPVAPATSRVGSEYDVASLGVSGWTDTPYNVAVGGTDFEDAYNSKEGGAPLSTYWSATNSAILWLCLELYSGDALGRFLRQRSDLRGSSLQLHNLWEQRHLQQQALSTPSVAT